MYSHLTKSLGRAVALAAAIAIAPACLSAQTAATKPHYPIDGASRWDIFLGYSYLAPKGTVDTPLSDGTTLPYQYKSVDEGAIGSVSYFFNKYVGAQVEGSAHVQESDAFGGGSAGIIFRYPTSEITPFVHGLVGGEKVGGPHYQKDTWGPVVTVGGGLDYNTPLLGGHLAIRVFQADYQYIHADFGPVVFGGRANINAARLSAGLVFHVGQIAPPPPVTLACSASPSSVYPGDPVTVTATATNVDPKKKLAFTWSGVAGLTGDTTVQVPTASLAPGSYTIKGHVVEGPGTHPWEVADCSTGFTVNAYQPPTISCSANPGTIKPGDSSTITSVGASPQNRPLTYSYSVSAGAVSGTGTTAAYTSAGAPTGVATVTCNVADDKGQTATSTTTVTIEAPAAPPAPKTSALCSITFDKDKKRPARVDNEAKACLDDVALALQKQTDATAAVVGDATAEEKEPKHGKKHAHVEAEDLAGQRSVNTKDYLVKEKGIDASRVSVYTGTDDAKKVDQYLVPAGANFTSDVAGTTPVNESAVKPQVRKPLAEVHHKHGKKAKK